MTDNQTYNQSYTSSISLFNGGWDRQAADDIEITATYRITSVTGDFTNSPPPLAPFDGFLIEFFPTETENCINGPPPCPSEIPFAQAFSANFTDTFFEDTVFGNSGHRFTIDLSASEIILDPGNWWVSIVAVDESGEKSSLERWRILLTDGLADGVPVHGRAGGQDHGNGYGGGELPDWKPLCFSGGCEPTPGDLAIRLEGTLVEPVCPADMDGDGSVGVADLLLLLGSWGPCKGCPADLDGDGNVGVSDLLALLAAWGPCP
ncbi:MAG: hypothetical protein V3W34_16725 [Phycisphaerae bacterium]